MYQLPVQKGTQESSENVILYWNNKPAAVGLIDTLYCFACNIWLGSMLSPGYCNYSSSVVIEGKNFREDLQCELILKRSSVAIGLFSLSFDSKQHPTQRMKQCESQGSLLFSSHHKTKARVANLMPAYFSGDMSLLSPPQPLDVNGRTLGSLGDFSSWE